VGASAFTHPAALVACLAAVIGFAVFAGCAEQAGSYFRSPGDSTADATGGEPGSPRAGHAVTGT
jgi:hypothetical protein